MDWIGITKEQLSSICAKWAPALGTTSGKLFNRVTMFADRFHQEEIADLKRNYPNWEPDDDDVSVMDHAVAWMALKEEITKANNRRKQNVLQ